MFRRYPRPTEITTVPRHVPLFVLCAVWDANDSRVVSVISTYDHNPTDDEIYTTLAEFSEWNDGREPAMVILTETIASAEKAK